MLLEIDVWVLLMIFEVVKRENSCVYVCLLCRNYLTIGTVQGAQKGCRSSLLQLKDAPSEEFVQLVLLDDEELGNRRDNNEFTGTCFTINEL